MSALLALGRLAAWFGYQEYEDPSPSYDVPLDDLVASPPRVSVVNPTSYEDAQELADHFKRRQIVIVNLQNLDEELWERIVDFCAGLTYALGGQVRPVADRLVLLVPRDVEVLDEQRSEQLVERVFFNRL